MHILGFGRGHKHEHSHDHSHEHTHSEITPAILLAHMIDHNRNHVTELESVAATLSGEAKLSAGSTGCIFRDRCPWADAQCAAVNPALCPVPGESGRLAACIRPGAERS